MYVPKKYCTGLLAQSRFFELVLSTIWTSHLKFERCALLVCTFYFEFCKGLHYDKVEFGAVSVTPTMEQVIMVLTKILDQRSKDRENKSLFKRMAIHNGEQLLFSCLCSKVAYYVKCQLSIVNCQMSSVKCQMSNAYVDPWDMLTNFSFHV